MKSIILDGDLLTKQDQAHLYLKEMLELPDYYGKNLDALYGCLTELSEIDILIRVGELETAYLRKVLRVFQEAAEENVDIKLNIE